MHRFQPISLSVSPSLSSMSIVSGQDEIEAKKKVELALLKGKIESLIKTLPNTTTKLDYILNLFNLGCVNFNYAKLENSMMASEHHIKQVEIGINYIDHALDQLFFYIDEISLEESYITELYILLIDRIDVYQSYTNTQGNVTNLISLMQTHEDVFVFSQIYNFPLHTKAYISKQHDKQVRYTQALQEQAEKLEFEYKTILASHPTDFIKQINLLFTLGCALIYLDKESPEKIMNYLNQALTLSKEIKELYKIFKCYELLIKVNFMLILRANNKEDILKYIKQIESYFQEVEVYLIKKEQLDLVNQFIQRYHQLKKTLDSVKSCTHDFYILEGLDEDVKSAKGRTKFTIFNTAKSKLRINDIELLVLIKHYRLDHSLQISACAAIADMKSDDDKIIPPANAEAEEEIKKLNASLSLLPLNKIFHHTRRAWLYLCTGHYSLALADLVHVRFEIEKFFKNEKSEELSINISSLYALLIKIYWINNLRLTDCYFLLEKKNMAKRYYLEAFSWIKNFNKILFLSFEERKNLAESIAYSREMMLKKLLPPKPILFKTQVEFDHLYQQMGDQLLLLWQQSLTLDEKSGVELSKQRQKICDDLIEKGLPSSFDQITHALKQVPITYLLKTLYCGLIYLAYADHDKQLIQSKKILSTVLNYLEHYYHCKNKSAQYISLLIHLFKTVLPHPTLTSIIHSSLATLKFSPPEKVGVCLDYCDERGVVQIKSTIPMYIINLDELLTDPHQELWKLERDKLINIKPFLVNRNSKSSAKEKKEKIPHLSEQKIRSDRAKCYLFLHKWSLALQILQMIHKDISTAIVTLQDRLAHSKKSHDQLSYRILLAYLFEYYWLSVYSLYRMAICHHAQWQTKAMNSIHHDKRVVHYRQILSTYAQTYSEILKQLAWLENSQVPAQYEEEVTIIYQQLMSLRLCVDQHSMQLVQAETKHLKKLSITIQETPSTKKEKKQSGVRKKKKAVSECLEIKKAQMSSVTDASIQETVEMKVEKETESDLTVEPIYQLNENLKIFNPFSILDHHYHSTSHSMNLRKKSKKDSEESQSKIMEAKSIKIDPTFTRGNKPSHSNQKGKPSVIFKRVKKHSKYLFYKTQFYSDDFNSYDKKPKPLNIFDVLIFKKPRRKKKSFSSPLHLSITAASEATIVSDSKVIAAVPSYWQFANCAWLKPMQYPSIVKNILFKIKNKGFLVRVWGGCIRNRKNPADYDLWIIIPEQSAANFAQVHANVHQFLTAHQPLGLQAWQSQHRPSLYKLSLADEKTGKVYDLDISVSHEIQSDYKINSLIADENGNIQYSTKVYPCASQVVCDLTQKCLDTIENPEISFNKDGLRILRGLRLLVVENCFLTSRVSAAIYKNHQLKSSDLYECIVHELGKYHTIAHQIAAVKQFSKYGILNHLLPLDSKVPCSNLQFLLKMIRLELTLKELYRLCSAGGWLKLESKRSSHYQVFIYDEARFLQKSQNFLILLSISYQHTDLLKPVSDSELLILSSKVIAAKVALEWVAIHRELCQLWLTGHAEIIFEQLFNGQIFSMLFPKTASFCYDNRQFKLDLLNSVFHQADLRFRNNKFPSIKFIYRHLLAVEWLSYQCIDPSLYDEEIIPMLSTYYAQLLQQMNINLLKEVGPLLSLPIFKAFKPIIDDASFTLTDAGLSISTSPSPHSSFAYSISQSIFSEKTRKPPLPLLSDKEILHPIVIENF